MATSPFYLQQFEFLDGSPAAGGKLYVYQQGTSIPATVYVDHGLTTAATQPIILDATGTVPQFWENAATGLKFALYDPRTGSDTLVWSRDYIDVSGTASSGVQSVGISLGSAMDAIADVSNSPVTTSGNIGIELAKQNPNLFLGTSGSADYPAFRQIAIGQISGVDSAYVKLQSVGSETQQTGSTYLSKVKAQDSIVIGTESGSTNAQLTPISLNLQSPSGTSTIYSASSSTSILASYFRARDLGITGAGQVVDEAGNHFGTTGTFTGNITARDYYTSGSGSGVGQSITIDPNLLWPIALVKGADTVSLIGGDTLQQQSPSGLSNYSSTGFSAAGAAYTGISGTASASDPWFQVQKGSGNYSQWRWDSIFLSSGATELSTKLKLGGTTRIDASGNMFAVNLTSTGQGQQFSSEFVTSGKWAKVATTQVASTTTRTSLWGGSQTIPANRIATTGQIIHVKATGRLSGANAAGFTIDFLLDGVNVRSVSDTLPSAITDGPFRFEGDLTFRSVGSGGQFWGYVMFHFAQSGGKTQAYTLPLVLSTVSTNYDTTAAHTLDIGWTWATASASNDIRCDGGSISIT